jgi:hypothetical protein
MFQPYEGVLVVLAKQTNYENIMTIIFLAPCKTHNFCHSHQVNQSLEQVLCIAGVMEKSLNYI